MGKTEFEQVFFTKYVVAILLQRLVLWGYNNDTLLDHSNVFAKTIVASFIMTWHWNHHGPFQYFVCIGSLLIGTLRGHRRAVWYAKFLPVDLVGTVKPPNNGHLRASYSWHDLLFKAYRLIWEGKAEISHTSIMVWYWALPRALHTFF